jgi:uncharacterized RDD family membrane protein YckC
VTTFGTTPPDDPQQPPSQPAEQAAPQSEPPVGAGTVSPDGRWIWDGYRWTPHPAVPPPPPGYVAPSGYGPPGYGPPPGYPGYGPPVAGPAPGLAYGGFWIRFVAALLDGLILLVPTFILAAAAGGFVRTDEFGQTGINGSAYGLSILLDLIYYIGFWATMSRTPGMMALNLRIVRVEDGAPIDATRAVLRAIGFIVSYLPFCIGLIWAAFDPRKQGWHDKIAGTLVVRPVPS